jgi:hypothetical protein
LCKATSTIKSTLDVLRGQTKANVSRMRRVENPAGGQKLNITLAQIWMNASAPANVIADVEPPQLPHELILPGTSEQCKETRKPKAEDQDDERIEVEELVRVDKRMGSGLEALLVSIRQFSAAASRRNQPQDRKADEGSKRSRC